MAYVKKTLAPGEEYSYRAHFNWTYDFQSWFWFALGAVPALLWLLAYALRGAVPATGPAFFIPAGAALAIGLVILTTRYVHRWTTVVALTNMRLIMKTGLIARKAHEVSLDKIEEVLVTQSFLGRIFGYGVLAVHGTGAAVIRFPILRKPVELRRRLETASAAARKNARQGAQASA